MDEIKSITGVVRTIFADCKTWKSSRSVSPVSSVHFKPCDSNFADQSVCLSLQSALIGATITERNLFSSQLLNVNSQLKRKDI